MCILSQPGEYGWIVRVLRRCGLIASYSDHFLPVAAVAVLSSSVSQDKDPEIHSLVARLSCILIQFNIQQLTDGQQLNN